MKWMVAFLVLVAMSIDIWNWGKSKPFFMAMPYWVWHVILILLLTSLFYALFAKYGWREKND